MRLFDQTKHTKWYIDKKGIVYSQTTWHDDNKIKIVKPNNNKQRGYLYARTSNNNFQIHRLVAVNFISNPENKPHVNHRDGNKHNNHHTNLEWVTVRENAQHAIKNGLMKQMKKNEGNMKYTTEQCRTVLERSRQGMTHLEAGSIFNMPYSTVAHLIRGSRREI